MTIRDKTINEILVKTTTKVMGRPTQASIEKTGNELSNIGTSTKKTNIEFPEGTKFGYAEEIITAR